ncbi:MAG: hypothetical protein Q9163_003006 [Psora crenata]
MSSNVSKGFHRMVWKMCVGGGRKDIGSGKTTLILNLIPQLPKTYKLALLKNEFGDLKIDSQLASSSSISGVKELLNGCICCNLVGQLGDALDQLRNDVQPDRIIIETSGSAFPATLAMEVNRLGRERGGFVLDGVIVVIDVENWKGYDDTSYTAKMQARYTDLVVFNKWELVDDTRYEECLDRIGDLELQVASVKSDKGRVDQSVLLGLDSALAAAHEPMSGHAIDHEQSPDRITDHQSEVEVLSITLLSQNSSPGVNIEALNNFLTSAPKDEIYRIKAIIRAAHPPPNSDSVLYPAIAQQGREVRMYILNWAFGRWTFTLIAEPQPIPMDSSADMESDGKPEHPIVRMTLVLARYEAEKWKKRLEAGGYFLPDKPDEKSTLLVLRLV